MSNPYYTRTFDVLPGTVIASQAIENQFQSVEAGFDGVKTAVDSKDAAIALKATKAGDTYTGTHNFSGATAVTVPASPLTATAAASKAYVDDQLAAAAAAGAAGQLPGQAGNAGRVLRTDGTTASWHPDGGPVTVVSGATQTAESGNQYALTNAAQSTLTLPASPAAGYTVVVSIANSRTDNVIARNGSTIMGLAEDMTVDNANATVTLRFINSTWRLV